MDTTKFYIDGKWVTPEGTQTIDVINPSDETGFATITLGSEADTNIAVSAAKSAFPAWSMSTREQRIGLLERLLETYSARAEEMAQTISKEMGAPINLARTAGWVPALRI